ncbi:hypothetical protein AYI70_g12376 [Smittium culicis]|uniref:DUF3752 domain-containing protein n=1 Tax=Smittium culicis TaxID=133412 RepID=A0A1R1WXR9_9FUNG|nr:hypothetical protein AYI70_g12376 [Smittium culicis]
MKAESNKKSKVYSVDFEDIGPKLPSASPKNEKNHKLVGPSIGASNYTQLEAEQQVADLVASRLAANSSDSEENSGKSKRAEWMIVPPTFSIASGATRSTGKARKFEAASTTQQKFEFDESWTQVPGTEISPKPRPKSAKSSKEDEGEKEISSLAKEEKRKQEEKKKEIVDTYNSNFRPKSLMEMHQEKLASLKRKSGNRHQSSTSSSSKSRKSGSNEDTWKQGRFSRDRDMAVKWVDSKRNSDIASQTEFLKEKYGHGSKSSFL